MNTNPCRCYGSGIMAMQRTRDDRYYVKCMRCGDQGSVNATEHAAIIKWNLTHPRQDKFYQTPGAIYKAREPQ